MKVLITGANGMVARAVAKHCAEMDDDVYALARQQLDIADAANVAKVFDEIVPEAVLNCAAYTDVDGAESNANASHAANAIGVQNLANACRKIDAAFVTISTDYVFDGSNPGFYTQRDTPNPQGVYAATKREGEMLSLNSYARTIVVRSGWIYGYGGTNFLSIMGRLLSEGKPIKAIRDSYGTPTFANHLAIRLRELASLDMPGIFHATNSGSGTSYLGFAEKVCEIGGFDSALIESVSKDDLKRPAPRPASSKLACLFSERFGLDPMPDWEEALSRFLEKMQKPAR
jgi:dTDP-4-dehydrorhamnose reductase